MKITWTNRGLNQIIPDLSGSGRVITGTDSYMEMSFKMIDKCEWCGMAYPRGGWQYYEIIVFDISHKICGDCYGRLVPILPVSKNDYGDEF